MLAATNEPVAKRLSASFLERGQMIDSDANKLVALARGGDQDAFAQLYRGNLPQIRAVGCEIFRGPGSAVDLEDFCSDVWLLALKYLGSFREECQFSTWIVQIAKHKVLAILQRRSQTKNGDGRLVYQSNETSDDQWESQCFIAQDRRLEASMASTDVRLLLEAGDLKHRGLIQLYHLEGFSETEIASQTGLSVPAVRGRLSRAMVQLRKKVEKGTNRNAPNISLPIQRVILRKGESSE